MSKFTFKAPKSESAKTQMAMMEMASEAEVRNEPDHCPFCGWMDARSFLSCVNAYGGDKGMYVM